MVVVSTQNGRATVSIISVKTTKLGETGFKGGYTAYITHLALYIRNTQFNSNTSVLIKPYHEK